MFKRYHRLYMSKTKPMIFSYPTPFLFHRLPNLSQWQWHPFRCSGQELRIIFDSFLSYLIIQSVSKWCCFCLQNTLKKLTTTCYLHCYYSLQVTSRLDYCNHLLVDFPAYTVAPLQFSHQLNRVAKVISENTSFISLLGTLNGLLSQGSQEVVYI